MRGTGIGETWVGHIFWRPLPYGTEFKDFCIFILILEEEQEVPDPFPDQLKNTVSLRARHDFLFGTLLILTVFALHSTSLFTATRPYFIVGYYNSSQFI